MLKVKSRYIIIITNCHYYNIQHTQLIQSNTQFNEENSQSTTKKEAIQVSNIFHSVLISRDYY